MLRAHGEGAWRYLCRVIFEEARFSEHCPGIPSDLQLVSSSWSILIFLDRSKLWVFLFI